TSQFEPQLHRQSPKSYVKTAYQADVHYDDKAKQYWLRCHQSHGWRYCATSSITDTPSLQKRQYSMLKNGRDERNATLTQSPDSSKKALQITTESPNFYVHSE